MFGARGAAFLFLVMCVVVCAHAGSSKWLSSLSITSFDGTVLRADAFIPTPESPADRFPVVVFPNSWGVPQIEYIVRALQLGDKGYVALEYETRGWYLSGGEIDTAGPLDIQDGQRVLDYIAANATAWQADMSRVAFAGISYGAGISLLMAGSDSRVTVAVALSGWNNLTDFAYGERCPSFKQTDTLLKSAEKLGHPSPDLFQLYSDLSNHTNMTFVKQFGETRSPQRLVNAINTRNIPVLLSNNFLDRFFRPQYMLNDFFPALTGPKMMLLNNGPHAFPEGAGLVLNTSFIWNKVLLWFERHLQNVSNGIDHEKKLQIQLGRSMASPERLLFDEDPTASTLTDWYLSPRDGNVFGGIVEGVAPNASSAEELQFTSEPALTSGVKDDTWESLGIPFVTNLAGANQSTALIYTSHTFTANRTLCGTPHATLQVQSSSSTGFQVYSFLYDINSASEPGSGDYITESFYTQWESTPGLSYTVDVQFSTACHTLAEGHRVALGIVLYNEQYVPANYGSSLQVTYGASVLRLPLQ